MGRPAVASRPARPQTRRVFDVLRRDLARYNPGSGVSIWRAFEHGGAWATMAYRFSEWTRSSSAPAWVRAPLRPLASLFLIAVRAVTHVDLPAGCRVGPGLYIAHPGHVVVARGTVLGENCTLTPGVVLGHGLGGENSEAGPPRIGNRVYLGPGAKAVGEIEIGDDALVGIGAVVTRSLPARAVAVGNPARVIAETGAFDVLAYPGMADDPARQASLALRAGNPTTGDP